MDISHDLRQIRHLRQQQAETFAAMNAVHNSVKAKTAEGKAETIDEDVYEQLRVQYKDSFVWAAEELNASSNALQKLQRYIQGRIKRQNAKRKREADAAAASKPAAKREKNGNIWNFEGEELQPGQKVAALTDPHSIPPLWIVATIVSHEPRGNRDIYVVLDADDSTEVRKRAKIDAKKIVPLYSLQEYPMSKRRILSVGERVLALFPLTTVFYPCNVVAAKASRSEYVLQFDDDEVPNRVVSAEDVFPFPEDYK